MNYSFLATGQKLIILKNFLFKRNLIPIDIFEIRFKINTIFRIFMERFMSVGLAPRPANEEQRAKAVVKTGLIDSPNPDLFQVYCDLAKDITGFANATFSLFDGEMQCAMALTEGGHPDPTRKVGDKGLRTKDSICAYVLLETEPLLIPDISKDPIWKDHPQRRNPE